MLYWESSAMKRFKTTLPISRISNHQNYDVNENVNTLSSFTCVPEIVVQYTPKIPSSQILIDILFTVLFIKDAPITTIQCF
jgi:hypothetical protein